TEGVDLPSANCILFARPTKSQIVYSQSIGRGTRLSPETGKTDCLVLDLVGASNRFDLVTLGDLVGVKELKEGESIVEAVKREKREAEETVQQGLPAYAEGEVVGREVDLFGGRQWEKTSLFDWRVFPEERRALLIAGGKRYEVWRQTPTSPYRFAAMDLSARWEGVAPTWHGAKVAVEAKAKEIIFGGRSAIWRSGPATEKQIALLIKFRAPFDPHITKGEASDLLDGIFKKARAA